MVLRKKNLLDAFREAAPEGRLASTRDAEASASGGPFAPVPARPLAPEPARDTREPHAASRERAPSPPAADVPPRPPRPVETRFEVPGDPSEADRRELGRFSDGRVGAVLIVALLAVLAAWVIGRWSAEPAEAEAASKAVPSGPGAITHQGLAPAAVGSQGLAERNLAAARMGTPDDLAFMDPANKFTIRMIQYGNNETNLERARATVEHLRRKEGLPVVGPIAMGQILVVCAGHEPKVDDLQGLLKHVKALPGPPPQEAKRPFADAYVVNIDDVVRRQ